MAPNRRLRRIELYCPEYETAATISINPHHGSGTPHLEVHYARGGKQRNDQVAAAIPDDWTDGDLIELIFQPPRRGTGRDWPPWEISAADFATPFLFRFWKGEKPPKE